MAHDRPNLRQIAYNFKLVQDLSQGSSAFQLEMLAISREHDLEKLFMMRQNIWSFLPCQKCLGPTLWWLDHYLAQIQWADSACSCYRRLCHLSTDPHSAHQQYLQPQPSPCTPLVCTAVIQKVFRCVWWACDLYSPDTMAWLGNHLNASRPFFLAECKGTTSLKLLQHIKLHTAKISSTSLIG